MKRLTILFAAVIALSLLFGGCAGGDAPEEGAPWYRFVDSAGNEVALDAPPQRVAVLLSSYAEIWTLAGGTVGVTVGDSVKRGFCPADTPLVDKGAGMSIDVEKLVSLQPDFVIASSDMPAQVEAVNRLKGAQIPCALFVEETIDDYLFMLKIFTDLNDAPDRYRQYGTEVKAQADAVLRAGAEAAAGREEPVSVLFVRAGSGGSSTRAKTADNHFVGIMLRELSTVNIADAAKELSESLSLEHVVVNNPDRILIVPQGDEDAAIAYMNSVLLQPGWRDLDAVRQGNVTFLPKDLFHFKPNARWAEAYRMLAETVYGEEVLSG